MKLLNKLIPLFFIYFTLGCGSDDVAGNAEVDQSIVGYTTVALDANKNVVRGNEAILGNLIADSFLDYAKQKGFMIDFALVNGGNIRFSSLLHPNGVYPIGNITAANIDELLPFGDSGIVIQITGAELKSTLERSVNAIPIPDGSSGSGAFMQLSSGIQIVVDSSQQNQVIDELTNVASIVTEGQRIVQVLINGESLDLQREYLVLVPEFVADGGDGFVALNNIEAERKTDLQEPLDIALDSYLRKTSPVTPILENRILID